MAQNASLRARMCLLGCEQCSHKFWESNPPKLKFWSHELNTTFKREWQKVQDLPTFKRDTCTQFRTKIMQHLALQTTAKRLSVYSVVESVATTTLQVLIDMLWPVCITVYTHWKHMPSTKSHYNHWICTVHVKNVVVAASWQLVEDSVESVNKVAERVLLRLRQELSGLEDGVKLSIAGQVNHLIQEARDENNLCRLVSWLAGLHLSTATVRRREIVTELH